VHDPSQKRGFGAREPAAQQRTGITNLTERGGLAHNTCPGEHYIVRRATIKIAPDPDMARTGQAK